MEILISLILGYVLGSIPSAYLIVKKITQKDITKLGSGNVGTLNSFEVTNSKVVGLSVLFADFSKGALTVLLIKYFISDDYFVIAIGSISAVLAHCYTPWLNFKGGRGLATAAGCFLFVVPLVALLWMAIWVIAFIIKKNVHFGNIAATIGTGLITFIIPEFLYYIIFIRQEPNTILFTISIAILMTIIFSKHFEPLRVLIKTDNIKRRKK